MFYSFGRATYSVRVAVTTKSLVGEYFRLYFMERRNDLFTAN
jgi:hypothetical protein